MGRRPTVGPQNNVLELGVATCPGVDLFVDGQNGKAGAKGLSWSNPLSTVDEAFDRLITPKFFSSEFADNARIFILGTIREQISSPELVSGVQIIGAVGGTPRFGTENGVAVSRFASYWTYPASGSTANALLKLVGRGVEIRNIMFVPKNGYAAIQLDNASTYQGGNCLIQGCKFNGPNGTAGAQGYGIDANGGGGFVWIKGNRFFDLETAIVDTAPNTLPLRWEVGGPGNEGNLFESNKNDLKMTLSRGLVQGNQFRGVYNASTHPVICSTVANGDATTGSRVVDNWFDDTSLATAKGHFGSSADYWWNHVSGTAAYVTTVPT